MKEGDAAKALDEYLYAVDYNWYAYDFSKATFDYNTDRMYNKAEGTWGEGLIQRPNEDLYDVIHSLMAKMDTPDAEYAQEMEILTRALENQQQYREELNAELAENVQRMITMLDI